MQTYPGETQRHYSDSGQTWLCYYGMWQIPYHAALLCPDGVIRHTHRIAAEPDTFFSIPCAVKVRGKTVTGFLTTNNAGEYTFHPSLYLKNGHVFDKQESVNA